MKLTIKAPEDNKRYIKRWQGWDIQLDGHKLDGLYGLYISFDDDGLVNARLDITVDDLEFDGDIMGELRAIIESRRP